MKVIWKAPTKRTSEQGGKAGRLHEFLGILRKHPNRWAIYPFVYSSVNSAQVSTYRTFRKPGFESTSRGNRVHARYVGTK